MHSFSIGASALEDPQQRQTFVGDIDVVIGHIRGDGIQLERSRNRERRAFFLDLIQEYGKPALDVGV